jgi:hypothetical protein
MYTYSTITNKYLLKKIIFSFLEYDPYTNSIVIIKNVEDILFSDVNFLIFNSIKTNDLLVK